MKKTYFSPVTRSIDLSMEIGCLGDNSQIPIHPDPSDPSVPDESEVLTKGQGIWGWTED